MGGSLVLHFDLLAEEFLQENVLKMKSVKKAADRRENEELDESASSSNYVVMCHFGDL